MSARRQTTDILARNQITFKYVINRFDGLIASTNAKAGMIGAYCTFVLGAVVFKWNDLTILHGTHSRLAVAALVLTFIVAAATTGSLWFVFRAANPYLRSQRKPGSYHSNLFFGHVAEHATPEDYLKLASECDDVHLETDLGTQAHALACGLNEKYRKLKYGIGLILWVQLPAILALVIIQLSAVVIDFL